MGEPVGEQEQGSEQEVEASEGGGIDHWPDTFDLKFFIDRIKLIALKPADAVRQVNGERATVGGIYTSYLFLLIAVPVVCEFVRMVTLGFSIPFVGTFRWPIFGGLISSVTSYGLMLTFPLVAALIVEKLTPHFEGETDFIRSLKLMVCALTPGLAAGLLMLTPFISFLAVLFGMYGVYIFYLGVPVLTGVPEARRVPFLVVSFVTTIVVFAVLTLAASWVKPGPPVGSGPSIKIQLPNGEMLNTESLQKSMEQLQKSVGQGE